MYSIYVLYIKTYPDTKCTIYIQIMHDVELCDLTYGVLRYISDASFVRNKHLQITQCTVSIGDTQ